MSDLTSRILIVDDEAPIRALLGEHLQMVGYQVMLAANGSAALETLAAGEFDLVLTDVRMPGMTGLELLRELGAKQASLPTIVITGHGDISLAVEAMKAGAVDFIEKPFEEEAILRAVRMAEQRARKEGRQSEDSAALAAKLASLSERERQVLQGLVAGHANKVIAFNLGISPRTVEVYRANLMTKMQAKSLSELIRMALLAHLSA
jgi:two-component system response regulator FixJ